MENGPAGTLRGALDDLRRLLVGADYPPSPPVGPPGRWRRRWQRIQPFVIPVLVFAVFGLTVAGVQYLTDTRDLAGWLVIGLGIGGSLPAVLAPFRPLLAWRLGYLMLFVGVVDARPADTWPWSPVQVVAFLFVLLLLAGRTTLGVAAWAGLLSVVPAYLFVGTAANAHGVAVLFTAVVLVGDQVRRRRQSQRALAEQAERSELEQARRAVLEERTRIAREMHDVVAHHMSMIAVQAETAPYRLAELSEPARAEFTAIAGSAREALADMRRLLGVLRSESPAAPETAPQPSLADVPELVEAARRAGMAVTVAADPAPVAGRAVPEAVGLAAYRIIQEALANAARHAPGTAVRVAVDAGEQALTIGVWNDPAGAPAGRPPEAVGPAGHGLTGMRERARLLGGRLRAGPTSDQGYAVTAYLPYDGPAEAAG
ncbi:sensor histidine kinase [Plantactinospora sp. WMMC1484]|uniref:sensor histidine kinase n=1 Tax=Plantactinospora sp. WMMC1484 TaxID=3404122 RepID=UPI003BF5DFAE